MDRDEQILFLFIVMCKEIYDRYKNGYTINQSEKLVALMFMTRVIESYHRICKKNSIDCKQIFEEIFELSKIKNG